MLDIHSQGIVLVVKRVVCAMIGSATWKIRGIIFILQCISMTYFVLLGFVTQSVWLNPLKFMDLVFLREYGKLESWFPSSCNGNYWDFCQGWSLVARSR